MEYSDLGFYKKARQVTEAVNAELKTWPKTMQAQEIGRQVFRATTSVGTNIAEDHGRHIGQEYIHYKIIAQGSANEVDHWLSTAIDCAIGNLESVKRILALNTETRKMLAATIISLRNQGSKSVHETPSPYTPIPFNDESPAPYSPSPLQDNDDSGQEMP
jgi:four helix bundle protein